MSSLRYKTVGSSERFGIINEAQSSDMTQAIIQLFANQILRMGAHGNFTDDDGKSQPVDIYPNGDLVIIDTNEHIVFEALH